MIIHGNGANMHLIKNNEADFIITSPPYFSDESELDLMKPLKKQTEIDRLEKDIVNFALKLKPVFKERPVNASKNKWFLPDEISTNHNDYIHDLKNSGFIDFEEKFGKKISFTDIYMVNH